MSNLHHSTCCVIPPHLLRNVAANAGDAALRAGAAATLRQMSALGRERAAVRPLPATRALGKRRNVYDARHGQTLPGDLVLAEGHTRPVDVEANEAYDGSGATYDLFFHIFGRRSVDGRGMRLDSTVHYGRRFDNAMWDGRQMIYGDGDGELFNRFTAALDVIGHELTHGVTESSAALAYSGQTGALNEHISDAFGIMVKQYALGQRVSDSDWLIGEGLLGPRVRGRAVRSMACPGTAYDDPILGRDPQPAHMRDYHRTRADNGGVHINSGIPNRAFYLAAMAIGGTAWSVLGKIWYAVLTSKLDSHARFGEFADATVAVAAEMFGVGGAVHRAVLQAWREVGVPLTSASMLWRRRPRRRQERRRHTTTTVHERRNGQ